MLIYNFVKNSDPACQPTFWKLLEWLIELQRLNSLQVKQPVLQLKMVLRRNCRPNSFVALDFMCNIAPTAFFSSDICTNFLIEENILIHSFTSTISYQYSQLVEQCAHFNTWKRIWNKGCEKTDVSIKALLPNMSWPQIALINLRLSNQRSWNSKPFSPLGQMKSETKAEIVAVIHVKYLIFVVIWVRWFMVGINCHPTCAFIWRTGPLKQKKHNFTFESIECRQSFSSLVWLLIRSCWVAFLSGM